MTSDQSIIFIGSPLPDNMLNRRTLSYNAADNIAQNVMVKGLHQHYGHRLTVISELSEEHPDDLDLGGGIIASVVSSNGSNRVAYYLSLLRNYRKELRKVLRLNGDNRSTVVITRGAYIFIALPVILARLKSRLRWVPFIITTVEVPEYGFPLNLISKMSRWTSKRADGMIAYVATTARDYMPGRPSLEIAYAIDEVKIELYKTHQTTRPAKFTITYTGSLSETYNFDYVIKAIALTGDKYSWVFAGSGVYSTRIEQLARDSRYDVTFLGDVSNADAIKLQMSSHLLLCPRGSNGSRTIEYYSKYAASGKLTEYLCSGTPILASDVPSTSESIRPFMTLEKGQQSEQFVRDIEQIQREYESKLQLAKLGRQYAFEHFNAEYQNKRIYNFLESF